MSSPHPSSATVPPALEPLVPPGPLVERGGIVWHAPAWTPEALDAIASHLATAGTAALADLPAEALADAWLDTAAAFRDPRSPERRRLAPALATTTGLSPAGLDAGLDAVLGGVGGEAARHLLAAAARRPAADRSPVLVVLAGNLPALAVQPLLPALALRRPVLVKSASAEPLFAPAFVAALARREPRLADAVAAVAWRGGREELEAPLVAACGRVVAYGGEEAIASLRRLAGDRLVAYGPKTSLAGVAADAIASGEGLGEVAAGLARDVALFDQRGCLSIAAVYTDGDPGRLAAALGDELAALADRLPPGPLDAATAAAVQQVRLEATMRGHAPLEVRPGALGAGTVLVEPEAAFRPTPGARTVRVRRLDDLAALPALLEPWTGRLQGTALAGAGALALAPALAELGVSRTAPPGRLQAADALWHNGGLHPLEALGGEDER